MVYAFVQKRRKSNDRRRKELYMDLGESIEILTDLGLSEQVIVNTINDLDYMNPDRGDSCAAAAPATFDDDDMVKK